MGYYGTNEVFQNGNISLVRCQGWSPDVISIIRIFLRLKLWEEMHLQYSKKCFFLVCGSKSFFCKVVEIDLEYKYCRKI